MKKILIIMLVFFAFFIFGCDRKKTSGSNDYGKRITYEEHKYSSITLDTNVFYMFTSNDFDKKNLYLSKKYDDAFFAYNNLVVFVFTEGSSGTVHSFNFQIYGNIMYANYSVESKGVIANIAYWYVYVSFPKDALNYLEKVIVADKELIRGELENNDSSKDISYDGDAKNVVASTKVEQIQKDMTFEEVVEIIGEPVAELGSGAIWYEWNLDDGTKLQIQFTRIGIEDNNLYVYRIKKAEKYNFTNDCVLVSVKKEYSEFNKEWSLDFFGDLPIKEVIDLTYLANPSSTANPAEWRQILKIVMKEPSYEGVLDLIDKLSEFEEFEAVEPNYIGSWDQYY